MRGSNIVRAETGFDVAAKKRSLGSLSFGIGAASTEIFPCRERRTRICEPMSLKVKPRHALV